MQHIKISAEAVAPDFRKVKVVILEQTHRGIAFGRGAEFKAKNGVRLYSSSGPQVCLTGAAPTVYMQGSSRHRDNDALLFTTAQFALFKEAVIEFNAAYAVPMVAPKHIKIAGTPIGPDFSTVAVEVLEQTDFCANFGTSDAKGLGAAEFISGRIRLASDADDYVSLKKFIPKRHAAKRLMGTFYFLSMKNQMFGTKTTVTVEVWAELQKAVKAYNAFYANPTPAGAKKPAKAAAPKAAPARQACTEVVG